MSALDPVLEAATNPWGDRRFYPPGAHPATARWREHLRQILASGIPETHEIVVYIRGELALFEEGESRAKADYLRRYG